jgi:hypothetical protein
MSGDVTLRFVDIAELDSSIQKLADAAGSTVKEVLPAQMRLFAADLSMNTRPVGKTASAAESGRINVEKRIRYVYPSVGMMADLLQPYGERVQKGFIARVKKKDFVNAARILNDIFPSTYTIGEFDNGDFHKKQQFTKRVEKRLVVVNYAKVEAYIREKKKLVGFAKGGFAAAARQLGGTRGIPGFASRQNAPGTGSVTGDGKTLTVTMTNDVRYIEDALDAHGELRAIEFRKRAVDAVIKRMMDRKMRESSRSLR